MFGGSGKPNKSGSTIPKPPPSLSPIEKKGNSAATTKPKGSQLDSWKKNQPPVEKFNSSIKQTFFGANASRSGVRQEDDDDNDSAGMPPLVEITLDDRLWLLYEKNNIILPFVWVDLPYY